MDKYVGKRLDGRYELREIIGIGGMANIYKAYDNIEDREVAVKILKEEFMGNEEFLRNFRNESKAVAALSHPNIVKIYDVNFGDRIQYIVMEHIDGITLKEYIDQCKVLTWKDTVHFTVQILRGLQHAHDKGIVHRDIKPQNIMLLSDGTIKLMDFGIARFSRDTTQKMQSDKAIGSVHYISPEQARAEDSDEKSDIYSVGVMMYEMLTGRLPFDGETPEQIAVMQMEAIATQPRQLNETIPEGLEEIVVRAMQKNSRMRYQSAAEMLRDIDKFKKDPSIVFEYKYFPEEGTTKYFDAITEAKGDMEEEEEEKKSKSIPILAGLAIAFVLVAVLIVILYLFVIKPDKPKPINVPELVGLYYEDIKKEDYFEKLEIVVLEDSENKEAEGFAPGQIYYQDPAAGKEVLEGSKVNIRVSQEAETVELPDFKNQDSALVEQALRDMGLVPEVSQIVDDNIAKGLVISTDPEPGARVAVGSTVKLEVSMGPAATRVKVPDVSGMTEEQARNTLQSKKFTYKRGSDVESSAAAGTAVSQSPTGGSWTYEGAEVTVNFSKGQAAASSTPAGENSIDFSVKLPSGAKGSYTFTVRVDGKTTNFIYGGAETPSQIINAESVNTFNFSLKNSGKRSVVVWVSSNNTGTQGAFATWSSVDFDSGRKGNYDTNTSMFSFSNSPNNPDDNETGNARSWLDHVENWYDRANDWLSRVS